MHGHRRHSSADPNGRRRNSFLPCPEDSGRFGKARRAGARLCLREPDLGSGKI